MIRGLIVDFVTMYVFGEDENRDENENRGEVVSDSWIIKLGAFGLIMQILKLSSNDYLI